MWRGREIWGQQFGENKVLAGDGKLLARMRIKMRGQAGDKPAEDARA